MAFVRILLTLAICACALAGEPNDGARRAFRDGAYQGLVRDFGVPKAFWNPSHVAKAPQVLRSALRDAVGAKDGVRTLGILDCIDDVDALSLDEKVLKSQIAWCESFHKDGEKASRDTVLAPLLKALDRERRGKRDKGAPSSLEILRADGYRILREGVTWDAFRAAMLKPEVDAILADPAFIAEGRTPPGFDPRWLAGTFGNPELWDRAWTAAWAEAPNPHRVHGLVSRISHYRPFGLDGAQRSALDAKVESLWGLPYLWAESAVPASGDILPKAFWSKVAAARQRTGPTRDAERALSAVASNPRDHHELSLLREALGTEDDLKLVIEWGGKPMVDPGVAGWTEAASAARIAAITVRYESLVSARVAEERRIAEETRKAEDAARRAAEEARNREMRERMESVMGVRVQMAIGILEDIARGHFRNDRQAIANGIERMGAVASTFAESEAMMSIFRQRVQDGWDSGPGSSIASDGSVSTSEKAEVNALVRTIVNAMRAQRGGREAGQDGE